jgi:transposase
MVKQLTTSKRDQILGMIQSGISSRASAKHFNMNKSVAYQILKKFNATGTVKRSPGSGWKPKTTDRQDRQIVQIVPNDREVIANEIKSLLDISNVSDETIYRRIERLTNLKLCWKWLKPYINDFQRKWLLINGVILFGRLSPHLLLNTIEECAFGASPMSALNRLQQGALWSTIRK